MVTRTTLFFLLIALLPPAQGGDPYVVFGLSPSTEAAELQRRSPTCEHRDHFVRLSESDAHDGIGTIALIHTAGYDEVRIGFQRGTRAQPVFPNCRDIRASIEAQYGTPDASWDYAEERTEAKARQWGEGRFALQLRCFYADGELFAEALRSLREE